MSRSRPRLRRCLFALSALPVLAAGLYAQSCPDPCSQYVNNDDPTKLTQCCRQYMVSPSCNGECPSDPPGCSQYAGESEPQQGYDLQRCCSPPGGAPNTGDSYCTQSPIYFVQYNSTKCASCAPPTQVFYHSASTPTYLPMGGWSRSSLLTICIDPAFGQNISAIEDAINSAAAQIDLRAQYLSLSSGQSCPAVTSASSGPNYVILASASAPQPGADGYTTSDVSPWSSTASLATTVVQARAPYPAVARPAGTRGCRLLP